MSETVKIPKALADEIREMPWFALYENLEDFVLESTRKNNQEWMRVWTVEKPRKGVEGK